MHSHTQGSPAAYSRGVVPARHHYRAPSLPALNPEPVLFLDAETGSCGILLYDATRGPDAISLRISGATDRVACHFSGQARLPFRIEWPGYDTYMCTVDRLNCMNRAELAAAVSTHLMAFIEKHRYDARSYPGWDTSERRTISEYTLVLRGVVKTQDHLEALIELRS